MKINVCKSYLLDDMIYKSDLQFHREYQDNWYPQRTYKSDYSSKFVEEDVTIEKLQEYVNNGYAIKINC